MKRALRFKGIGVTIAAGPIRNDIADLCREVIRHLSCAVSLDVCEKITAGH